MTNKHTPAVSGMRERITDIRKHLDLNQKDFAQKVGCHRNRISDIERGLREAPKNTIFALCTELNIDLNWLVLGVGSMFQSASGQWASKSSEQSIDESNKQKNFLEQLIAEKEKLIAEKDARIKLLEQMLA